MGGCLPSRPSAALPACRLHLTVYEQTEADAVFNLKSEDAEGLAVREYVLTADGFLVFRHGPRRLPERHFFLRSLAALPSLEGLTVLGLTTSGAGRSLLTQCSANTLHQRHNALWQVLNFAKEPEHSACELREGDAFRFGTQRLRYVFCSAGGEPPPSPAFLRRHTTRVTPAPPSGPDTVARAVSLHTPYRCAACDLDMTADEPAFTLCECPGRRTVVHQACLGDLVLMKAFKLSLRHGTVYMVSHLACQTCERAFTTRAVTRESFYRHFAPETPAGHAFALFELLDADFTNVISGLLVLDLDADDEYLVGKSNKGDLVFRNETLSQRHAVLTVAKRAVSVRDLGSRYGTMVDFPAERRHATLDELTLIAGDFMVEVHPFAGDECTCNLDYEEPLICDTDPFIDDPSPYLAEETEELEPEGEDELEGEGAEGEEEQEREEGGEGDEEAEEAEGEDEAATEQSETTKQEARRASSFAQSNSGGELELLQEGGLDPGGRVAKLAVRGNRPEIRDHLPGLARKAT